MGRDPTTGNCLTKGKRFNPRARMGRDAMLVSTASIECEFQSTRPHGARPTYRLQLHATFRFQSTRPHGARLDGGCCCFRPSSVSIHAPAWGATCQEQGWRHADGVSIHAPAWGATRVGDGSTQGIRVSIHAPAWGATSRRNGISRFV